MPETYRKISELARVSQVADTDLFIVETSNGTKATTIETFRHQTVTKEDVGLGNVDNTSDATKNAAAVSLTNKTIAGGTFASPLNTMTAKNGYVINLSSAGATLGELKYTTDTNELYIGNGESNIKVGGKPEDMPISTATQTALNAKASLSEVQTLIGNKQDVLVSGTNIKKINNNSILGSGNLEIDALPSQSGQNGKFLTTDGSAASWATVDALPSQSGQNGKFLSTNGTTASWATVTVPTKISDLTDDTATNPIDKADTLTDLTATVTELNYVDGVTSAIQTQLDAKQATANLVTTITSSSTDAQYPSAKCVYDLIGNLETVLSQI